jgi:cell wall-associated NlpC family hydrolase
LPYLWGGNGPERGDAGFDCSGLTTAAYAAAGVTLPRTAHTQYRAGPLLPPGTPLQAGDLLFFGTLSRVHHVGIATGQGTMMIHAPRRGTIIRVQDARDLHDYLAASRPTKQ